MSSDHALTLYGRNPSHSCPNDRNYIYVFCFLVYNKNIYSSQIISCLQNKNVDIKLSTQYKSSNNFNQFYIQCKICLFLSRE